MAIVSASTNALCGGVLPQINLKNAKSVCLTSCSIRNANICNVKVSSRSKLQRTAFVVTAEVSQAEQVKLTDGKVSTTSGSLSWSYGGYSLKINYVEYSAEGADSSAPVAVLLPAFSDVSTVGEWAAVASSLAGNGVCVIVVDWPGFGASSRPPLEYNASIMEEFLVGFLSNPEGPVAGKRYVLAGAGHAGTVAAHAAASGKISPVGIAAVAPTWAGPLPIVFGNGEDMRGRYSLYRSLIRSPGLGWLLYTFALTSPSSMASQFRSHVYADKANVTDELIAQAVQTTRVEGARYAPASFVSGLLDPVASREEFVALFASLEGRGIPALAVASSGSPRRSKAEMEALKGAQGVTVFSSVRGALLPHEEYPEDVATQLLPFFKELA